MSIVRGVVSSSEREVLMVPPRGVGLESWQDSISERGYTKLDVARYYLAVSDGALRAAGGRPNVLVRYPNGIDGEFFFQKRAPQSRPDWIEVVTLSFPSGRIAEEVVPRDAAALVWMANLACLELHPHPVRADDLDHPDELRIDLDPVPGVSWAHIRKVAQVLHATLPDFGLTGWPKTSGSRGVHVNVRIERRWTFDEVRRSALAIAREVERRAPELPPASCGRKNGMGYSSTTTRTQRTDGGCGVLRAPNPDARVSAPDMGGNRIAEPRRFSSRRASRLRRIGASTRHRSDPCRSIRSSSYRRDKSATVWATRRGRHITKASGEPARVSRLGRSKPPACRNCARTRKGDALAGLERGDSAIQMPAGTPAGRRARGCDAWTLSHVDRIRVNLQHVPKRCVRAGALDPKTPRLERRQRRDAPKPSRARKGRDLELVVTAVARSCRPPRRKIAA